jgi:hypothetical protein
MAVVEADLKELEAELQQTFDQEEWLLPADESADIISTEDTAQGIEISMDLNTLGGSRPRAA